MFNKLRLRLTMINVVVVGLIFLLIVSAIYFIMAKGLEIQTNQSMRLIASDTTNDDIKNMPKWEKHRLKFIYVKLNNNNQIIQINSNPPMSTQEIEPLVQESLRKNPPRGILKYHREHYRFLKISSSDNNPTKMVFVSTDNEEETLDHLLTALTSASLIGLALTFFGSLFLADRALVPIKKSWQRQRDFVADASHELRTPLAVIQTNLELVLGNPEETVSSQNKWLENILAENRRMAKLVDDLLLLARADSEQETMEMKKFCLTTALMEVIEPFKPVASGLGIQLSEGLAPMVNLIGDENRIRQLAVILIDNALKHTPNGGKVKVALKHFENTIELMVSDTGEGIEPIHLDKIFQRFYRVDKARSRESGSTGLGLAIADWIVKTHGGFIKVNSSPGVGTTFTILLPKNK